MAQASVSGAPPDDDAHREAGRSPLLDSLATQALAQVAGRFRAGRADPDGSALDRLYSAAIGADPRACAEVARALIADGVAADRICDVHIPAVARRMGEDWVGDDLSFSAVTIGTARLQGLLRELDMAMERSVGPSTGGGAILLVVAAGADHTLGALVLASQLRRKGLSVRLSLGEDLAALAGAVTRAPCDAVFLSATVASSMPFLIDAAATIRGAMPAPPPLVLGGALLAIEGRALAEGGTRGGAHGGGRAVGAAFGSIDHVTCDPDEAIRLCGLTAAS